MTVGIYIRVSTLEQANEGYSIAAQKERLTAYCAAQGWVDKKYYVDEGVSAKDTNRPQLQLLLDHVKTDKIRTILVYRLDRFTRSVIDLYNLLNLLEKHNCTFKSATEIYDTSSAMGRMFIGLVALLAQWERENLSERVKMALEEKVSSGERVGNVPFGFDLNKDQKLVANHQATVVLDMIDKVRNGMSASQLVSFLNKTDSSRIWYPQGVLRVLRNPALYGATRWNDKVFENTHEGLITKEEFIKLQAVLEERTVHHKREVKSYYLFQGKLICPRCGNPLAVNRYVRKRTDGSQYQGCVYRCQNCWKKYKNMLTIGEQRFEDALYEYMKDVEIKDIEPVETKDERSPILTQLEQVEKMREKYQIAWAKDKMTEEEFDKRMDETLEIYKELKRKLAELKAPASIDTEAIKKVISTFNENFAALNQEEKSIFLSRFVKRIEFKVIPQPPKQPHKHKRGKDLVVVTNVEFH
jgi:site-specific DNA recombinase